MVPEQQPDEKHAAAGTLHPSAMPVVMMAMAWMISSTSTFSVLAVSGPGDNGVDPSRFSTRVTFVPCRDRGSPSLAITASASTPGTRKSTGSFSVVFRVDLREEHEHAVESQVTTALTPS
jgi:hypothetical protein